VQVAGASRTGYGGVSSLRRKCTSARTALAMFCLLYAALGLVPPGARAKVSPGERQSLVNLYLATNGSGWADITQGWHNHANSSVDPCDPSTTVWTGVTCSGTTSITYVLEPCGDFHAENLILTRIAAGNWLSDTSPRIQACLCRCGCTCRGLELGGKLLRGTLPSNWGNLTALT
jgi:hypothetical protein